MALEHPYFVLAYYTFQPVENPSIEVKTHKEFLTPLDATSRIYISEEGINGQLSLAKNDALRYIDWMHSRQEFKNMEFKVHEWHEQAFPRLVIKYRKYLVGRDRTVDLSNQGEHLSPEQWKEMLESEKEALLLDVRNTYEWDVGHFKGALAPPCETFREFEKYAEMLKANHDPKQKKVMMYCTGGIRCEVYSALLKDLGFEKVYQLQGGIIKYGLEQGTKHWQGKLFVFDDRLTVPIHPQEDAPVVGKCTHCKMPSEQYYNCSNTDCNTLFLSCSPCLENHRGCCTDSCISAPRLRPYSQQNPHKPFRRKHHYSLPTSSTESVQASCSLPLPGQPLTPA